MTQIGITKQIDKLGRLCIPKEIREFLGLERDVMLIVTDNGLPIKSTEYTLIKSSEISQGK